MEYAPHYPADPSLKGKFVWSVVLHAALAASVVTATIVHRSGESWGGAVAGGATVSVGVVQKMPGVPLPAPPTVTESRVVDESKGLYKSEPKPKEVPPPPDTTRLPKFEKDQPKYQTRPSKILEDKTPPPANAVPYGGGGAPSVPYSNSQSQFTLGAGTQAGLSVPGQGPGGEFGGRYPYFVEAIRNRISSNWLQSLIDPSIRYAPRVVVNFQILRDGTITNIQFMQRSGYQSVDDSARRAILASSPVMRLPNDYSGNSVNVEFWFDFKR